MSAGDFARERERAERALGAALYSAVELMLREQMGMAEGIPSAVYEETVADGAERNESFDEARFAVLRESVHGTEGESLSVQGEALPARYPTAQREVFLPDNAAAEKESSAQISVRALRRGPSWQRDDTTFAAARTDAQGLSEQIERDARRYDGGFYLY